MSRIMMPARESVPCGSSEAGRYETLGNFPNLLIFYFGKQQSHLISSIPVTVRSSVYFHFLRRRAWLGLYVQGQGV